MAAGACSWLLPRTGAFWSSAPPAPQPLALGRCSTSAPQQLGRPGALPGRGAWGAIGLGCVCVRVAPGPEGPLYGDALPAGLCTYCKKQLFESCCFGFCFLSLFPSPSRFTQLERRRWLVWALVWAAPAHSHCSTHFSSALPLSWQGAGATWLLGDGAGHVKWWLNPPRARYGASRCRRAGDRRGQGDGGSPTSHPWRGVPPAAPTFSLGPSGRAWLLGVGAHQQLRGGDGGGCLWGG